MIEALHQAAIVGCGLIGRRRAATLSGAKLVACADLDRTKANAIAQTIDGCTTYTDWRDMLDRVDCEIVVIATPHDTLAEVTSAAITRGRHVLVEKPAGRYVSEIEPILTQAENAGTCVRVGFNHRYHRAVRRARKLVDAGAIGELMFVRGLYGHGGRIDYHQEWRTDPKRSGGGELIDQGPHLIDLARWFLGDITTIQGFADTFYWNMPVDDNAFLLLRTNNGKAAMLHVSCSEWKNTFSFEIYGKLGKLHITGLGGSYGVERLAFYRMRPEMGPPETVIWEYPTADDSWNVEFAEFIRDIRDRRAPDPGLRDAIAALHVIERVYKGCGNDYRP